MCPLKDAALALSLGLALPLEVGSVFYFHSTTAANTNHTLNTCISGQAETYRTVTKVKEASGPRYLVIY